MLDVINSDSKRARAVLIAGAVLLLLACFLYNLYLVRETRNLGIVYDARWLVTDLEKCDPQSLDCPEAESLRVGDRMVQVGGLSFQEYVANPDLVPFDGYGPGDAVPVTVLRDGQTIDLEWRVRPINVLHAARFATVPLLVYGIFWLAGTFVLLYIRPANLVWGLLAGLYYLTTIWLVAGLSSISNVATRAILLRLVGWLMVGVMIHLHLVAPSPLIGRFRRLVVAIIYVLVLTLLGLQLTRQLPWFAYISGILFASLVSVVLLIARLLKPRSNPEKRTAQLMLAGILLALGPGILLAAAPLVLNIAGTDVTGIALSIVAMPVLPLFYTYALYRHQLGRREHQTYRLMVRYTVFLAYLLLLTVGFVLISNWIVSANESLAMLALAALALIVTWLPIRQPIHSFFERLAYGTRYSHQEILADFADRIPATVDREVLISLLKNELMPTLGIRQSALYGRRDQEIAPVYTQGMSYSDGPGSWSDVHYIIENSDQFLAPKQETANEPAGHLSWIQLIVPLHVQDRLTGIWLFGRRESNEIYSEEDVTLLDRLSSLVAVTLESSELLEALSHELATRRQAEARLADQSKRLALLHEIDRAILAAGSLPEIAQAAIDGICQLIPCIRASVFLFDKADETVSILAVKGSGKDVVSVGDTIPMSHMLATEKITKGELFILEDTREVASRSGLVRSLAERGIRTAVSAPLMASGNNVFGALSVAADEPKSFSPTHIEIVKEVATSVALAIHSARLKQELDENSSQLQLLSTRLMTAQETERKWLSHELHDEMGQTLTAIALNLATIEKNLPPSASDHLRSQLNEANVFVGTLTDQVRSLSLELRPTMLHDLGLKSTLRWYIGNYVRRQDKEVVLEVADLPDELPEEVEITAYRIVQEAFTNISRHAGANSVKLRVIRCDGYIQIDIEDDGCGFDPSSIAAGELSGSGIGLLMMRERVSTLGGRLQISSQPGLGTRITADIPYEESE